MAAAMNAINSYFILPSFEHYYASGFAQGETDVVEPTDFNDLYRLGGADEVSRQIRENARIPRALKEQPLEYVQPDKLRQTFSELFDSFFESLEDHDRNDSFMLQAPSASGKTSSFMGSLARACEKYPAIKGAAYFPTHALAGQEVENAKKLGIDAIQLYGRNEPGMCKMNEAIKEFHRLGGKGNTFSTFCDDGKGKTCTHKNGCPYLDQFETPRQLSCFTHAHWGLYPNKLEEGLYEGERPHFIFVDENFTGNCERQSNCPRAFFKESAVPSEIKRIVLNCLDQGKPLLENLRLFEIESVKNEAKNEAITLLENRLKALPPLNLDKPLLEMDATQIKEIFKKIGCEHDLKIKLGDDAVIEAIEDSIGSFEGHLETKNPAVMNWTSKRAIDRLDEVLKDLPSSTPKFKDISPGMSQEIALYKLRKKNKGYSIRAPLKQIIKELETTRPHIMGLKMYTKKDGNAIISTHYIVPISRHMRPVPYNQSTRTDTDFVPLIISDAHLNQKIVSLSLQVPFEIPVHKIEVKPKTNVIQVSSTEMSGKSLAFNAEQYMLDIQNIANAEKPYRCLIIGPQKHVGNAKKGLLGHPIIEALKSQGAKTCHFGGLRGIDDFKDMPCVISFSRLQPPTDAINDRARCWYGADNTPLNFTTEKIPQQYRMRDSSQRWAKVLCMSDERAQQFLTASREEEIEQGIFRLRPIHGEEKKCYILSNIPTSLEVDQLITMQELRGKNAPQHKIVRIFERFFDEKNPNASLVMPLSPSTLFPFVKDMFNSENVLRNYIVRNTKELKQFISKKTGQQIEEVSYRLGGASGRSRRAIVLIDDVDRIERTLNEIHGRDVVIEGVITDMGIIPHLLKSFWDATLEKGAEVLESIAQVAEQGVVEAQKVFDGLINYLSEKEGCPDLNKLSAFDVWDAVKSLKMEYG